MFEDLDRHHGVGAAVRLLEQRVENVFAGEVWMVLQEEGAGEFILETAFADEQKGQESGGLEVLVSVDGSPNG